MGRKFYPGTDRVKDSWTHILTKYRSKYMHDCFILWPFFFCFILKKYSLLKIFWIPGSERVTLNISGAIFETYFLTLLRFPETLLGDPRLLGQFYHPSNDHYFFDRNRHCFAAILYFFQSNGTLTCPPDVSVDVFETEVQLFCWNKRC